jgi:hypothetical protein
VFIDGVAYRALTSPDTVPPLRLLLLSSLILALLALQAVPARADADWLARLNAYRSVAGLNPVQENSAWYDGCLKHAIYVVKNDTLVHAESPSAPYYTDEGNACGTSSNVVAGPLPASDTDAIDAWMRAPFHGVGMVDPRLVQSEFAAYREADGGFEAAAALDVIRGRIGGFIPTGYPVLWPGDQSSLPLTTYWGGEYPDPLASCSGYAAPTGLPIIVQLGEGFSVPQLTGASVTSGGVSLEACAFDETSYANPDANAQALGRAVLGIRNAVVIIPRQPLEVGHTYEASLSANGTTYAWSFSISPEFVAGNPPPPALFCGYPWSCTTSVSWGNDKCSGTGAVSEEDILLALRFEAGLSSGTRAAGICPPMQGFVQIAGFSALHWGDLDCSGDINMLDLLKLMLFQVGLGSQAAPGCPQIGQVVTISWPGSLSE